MNIGNIIVCRVEDGITYTHPSGEVTRLTDADVAAQRAEIVMMIDERKADLAAFDTRMELLAAEPIADEAKL